MSAQCALADFIRLAFPNDVIRSLTRGRRGLLLEIIFISNQGGDFAIDQSLHYVNMSKAHMSTIKIQKEILCHVLFLVN